MRERIRHMHTVTQSREQVKSTLVEMFSTLVDSLFRLADEDTPNRTLEEETWKVLLPTGAAALQGLLACRARRIAKQDIAARRLPTERVHRRGDKDYWATVTTTFGPVSFPWFAYRERLNYGASRTHNPAKLKLFPAFNACRSSALCLEWETLLGSDHPFRAAQKALTFFTHDAVRLEDTTIARHLVRIGQLVSRQDMYRSPEEIIQVLSERATQDRKTGRPLLYCSSDAHALRRYVDDTWAGKWKMSNGIRLWCEDKKTGQVIHIGGEFTWGDCHAVHDIFQDLIARGILPADGDYGDGVHAQLVWLSDGMPWFKVHILPLFTDLVVILDAYHLVQAIATFIGLCFKPKSKRARRLLDRVTELVSGTRLSKRKGKKAKRRRGHKKDAGSSCGHHAHQRPVDPDVDPTERLAALITLICDVTPETKKTKSAQSRLFKYLYSDPWRLNYTEFRARGYQIGSGAMESLHRTGSQLRLKLPGATWLPHTSQAVFNIRMMRLAGNWDRFWNQTNLEEQFAAVQLPN